MATKGVPVAITVEIRPKPRIPLDAPAAEPIVEAQSVDKTYDTGKIEVHALRGVDLAVQRGEMAAIMGPSGSGKTTLLKAVFLIESSFIALAEALR